MSPQHSLFPVVTTALAVLMLVLVVDAGRYNSDNEELAPKKLAKSYAKINKYLDKNLGSSSQQQEAKTILASIEQLVTRKSSQFCSLFGDSDGSMVKTTKQLTQLPIQTYIGFQCDRSKRATLLERLDSAWTYDETRSATPNYPLTHLDRLMEHYALETVHLCDYDGKWPKLEFAFKQRAYDKINQLLASSLPRTDDVEANMNKLQELLAAQPKTGALSEAMKQLLALRWVASECRDDQRVHDILLRNDLALRGGPRVHQVNGATQGLSRTEKMFQYHVVQHELLCRPTVVQKFRAALKTLNPNTYRQVLGLAGSHYLKVADYGPMALSLREKQVSDPHFSFPLMDDYVKQKLSSHKSGPLLTRINVMNVRNLRIFIDTLRDEKSSDESRIMSNLFNPCGEFLSKFEKLVKLNEYGVPAELRKEELTSNGSASDLTTYHMVHAAYQACKYVIESRTFLYNKMSELKWY